MTLKKTIPLPNPEVWYQRLGEISHLAPLQRYKELVKLHDQALKTYLSCLKNITEESARNVSSDGRKKGIVVAHIMAWEEWQAEVFGDPRRLERIQNQLKLKGYEDLDSHKRFDFKTVDEFNTFQAEKYKDWSWKAVKEKAVSQALKLKSFFPDKPRHEWIQFLEATPQRQWKVTPTLTLKIRGGWFLWMVSLEHEAIEHIKDLIL